MSPQRRAALIAPGSVAVTSAAVTWLGRRGLDRWCTAPGWRRLNYRGSTVTLSEGPAVAAALVTAVVALGVLAVTGTDRRLSAGAAVAVAGAAVAGAVDDRASAREDERVVKGFAGHLRAVARGRTSAGVVKLGLITGTSIVGAAIRTGSSVDALVDGALVAGSANLANLFDLRPGRALKVTGLAALACIPGGSALDASLLGATFGVVVAALPADLGETSMLGDTGANALGAMLGTVACGRSRRTRVVLLGVVAALTAVSERVSFTAVIAGNPWLRRLDELGRAGA